MEAFEIEGGKRLSGTVEISGSKNGAVVLLAASLLNRGTTRLKNIPHIQEVERWIEVLKSMGVRVERHDHEVILQRPQVLELDALDKQAARKTRSIILLIGALVSQLKEYVVPQAGGCRLGSRTVQPHLFALERLGVRIETEQQGFRVKSDKLQAASKIVLYESGDTVTENVLLATAMIPGKTVIKLASANYMVQEVCFFLQQLGVKIGGVGTSTLTVEGVDRGFQRDVTYTLGEDPIEAMLFLSVAVVTQSQITIRRCPIDFLELELLKLEKMGFQYKIIKEYTSHNGQTRLADIETLPSKLVALLDKIHPLPFPGLNIDNLPFFVPIAVIAEGMTLIHDWVYEGRATYFAELNRLGARITVMDQHRVSVDGPSPLRGAEITAPPALRPAVIILVAMLAAHGRSVLRGIYPIERGYERLAEKLTGLGAEIRLIKEP